MWNILLDPLPEDWNGYPIDSDFQTGIQISQCMVDDTLSKEEQLYTARDLLFPYVDNQPDMQEFTAALNWFLNEYHHDNNSGEKSDVLVMDFDVDQWRIYAAFMNQYHIDLNSVKMHWFVFMGLLSNLNECSFINVMNIRQKRITTKMSAEEANALRRAKEVFALKPPKEKPKSASEQQAVDEFMKYANINREPNQSQRAD